MKNVHTMQRLNLPSGRQVQFSYNSASGKIRYNFPDNTRVRYAEFFESTGIVRIYFFNSLTSDMNARDMSLSQLAAEFDKLF